MFIFLCPICSRLSAPPGGDFNVDGVSRGRGPPLPRPGRGAVGHSARGDPIDKTDLAAQEFEPVKKTQWKKFKGKGAREFVTFFRIS